MFRASATCMDGKDSSEKATHGKGAKAFRLPRKGDPALKEVRSGVFCHSDIPGISFHDLTRGSRPEGKEIGLLSQFKEVSPGSQSGSGSHSSTPSKSGSPSLLELANSLSLLATTSPTPQPVQEPHNPTAMMFSKPSTLGLQSSARPSK